jgi:hypothetical protein
MAPHYEVFYSLEVTIRGSVQEQLQTAQEDWWEQRVRATADSSNPTSRGPGVSTGSSDPARSRHTRSWMWSTSPMSRNLIMGAGRHPACIRRLSRLTGSNLTVRRCALVATALASALLGGEGEVPIRRPRRRRPSWRVPTERSAGPSRCRLNDLWRHSPQNSSIDGRRGAAPGGARAPKRPARPAAQGSLSSANPARQQETIRWKERSAGLPSLPRVTTRTPFTLAAADVTEIWPVPGAEADSSPSVAK